MKIIFEGTLPEIVGEVLMFVQDANSMVTRVPAEETVNKPANVEGVSADEPEAAVEPKKSKRNGSGKARRKGRITVGGDDPEDDAGTVVDAPDGDVDVQDNKRKGSKTNAGSADAVSYSASDAGKAASSAAALVGPTPVRKIIAVLTGGSEDLKDLPEDKRAEFIDACAGLFEGEDDAVA
jgi:hypothetical protein|tara:strand:- start:3190 stop:3729 length:540 start_codon:yes stop_codon:yes gene_type:complete